MTPIYDELAARLGDPAAFRLPPATPRQRRRAARRTKRLLSQIGAEA